MACFNKSFGMMVVVCGPVIPMVVVSYAYKSYFNYGFTNKVPMDKQFHVVSDVIIALAVVGLISNFAAFFKAKTGISFVFWKKAILPFTIISNLISSIMETTIEICKFVSLLIVAHFLVWVMLGIVLKPETALPTISAIIFVLVLLLVRDEIGEFNEKIYSTLRCI